MGGSTANAEEYKLAEVYDGILSCLEDELPFAAGESSDGQVYRSMTDLWNTELGIEEEDPEGKTRWFASGANYWEKEENCPATVDGVLGGHGKLSDVDVKESAAFLAEVKVLSPDMGFGRAVDCGAGIGRVAKSLLIPRFETVDMVEQSERLLGSAQSYLENDWAKIGRVINRGLQDFHPESQTYDVVWIQWVISYLPDDELILFLRRCQQALRPGGVIVMKENVVIDGSAFVVDKSDSSLTRSPPYFRSLIKQAGLSIVKEEFQKEFPKDLFPVKMFALQ